MFRLGRRPWLRFFRFRELQGKQKIDNCLVLNLLKVSVFVNWVMQDHYKVLELNCDASDDEIRSSFIRLALVCFSFPLNLGQSLGLSSSVMKLELCCRNGTRTNLKKRILLRLGFKKSMRLIKVCFSFM